MQLIEIPKTGAPSRHRFDAERVQVGRSGDADLVLVDPALSREHLEFSLEDGRWRVRDVGSRNGTQLNGRPLLGGEALRPGDEIRLGGTTLVFVGADDAPIDEAVLAAETRAAAEEDWNATHLIGRSQALVEVRTRIEAFAAVDCTVLVRGEPGTGKELVARLLHEHSPRREAPFVVVNCPAIPHELFEAELFGVEQGAATSVRARPGRLRSAEGGTVFFDEIGDLDARAQAKLLRFLEQGTVDPVGADRPVPVDARVVAATNSDLTAACDEGRFRRDLLSRLEGVEIRVPSLVEHLEDLPDLVEHFLERGRVPAAGIAPEALEELKTRAWTGNVRGLRSTLESASAMAGGGVIGVKHLPAPQGGTRSDPVADLHRRLIAKGADFWEEFRRPFLDRTLSKDTARALICRLHEETGSYKEMARVLGIERQHKKLLNFLRDHGLRPDDD